MVLGDRLQITIRAGQGANALITGLSINAAWGIGTLVFLRLFR